MGVGLYRWAGRRRTLGGGAAEAFRKAFARLDAIIVPHNIVRWPSMYVDLPQGNIMLGIHLSRPARLILPVVLLLWSGEARAYIGPGMGVGAVVATLGVVLAFLLLLIAVVWYPIKRLWNRLFRRKT